jgi:tryptophan-rich sensory protein
MNRLASPAQLRASFVRWSLFIVPMVVLLGYISAEVAGNTARNYWYQDLAKPAFYPPEITFSVVWTVLYVIMGLAAAMVGAAWGSRYRAPALIAFVLQLLVNLAWSPVFFARHEITVALFIILVLDVAAVVMVVLFWKVRRAAAVLLLPYIAWVLFATALNYELLRLNPDADGSDVSAAIQRIEL